MYLKLLIISYAYLRPTDIPWFDTPWEHSIDLKGYVIAWNINKLSLVLRFYAQYFKHHRNKKHSSVDICPLSTEQFLFQR